MPPNELTDGGFSECPDFPSARRGRHSVNRLVPRIALTLLRFAQSVKAILVRWANGLSS